MNKSNNGGPAFPIKQPMNGDAKGMTLRDYFAAQAMLGEISTRSDTGGIDYNISETALIKNAKHWYRIADAMLKARES